MTAARKKFIELTEPLLIERGVDMRDPLEPGPDYYEGCYVEVEEEVAETTSEDGKVVEEPVIK